MLLERRIDTEEHRRTEAFLQLTSDFREFVQESRSDRKFTRERVDALYRLATWMVGGVFAFFMAVVALAVQVAI